MFWDRVRPLHGWRAFFGEVGVIVLGVLIALVAQQAVERWTIRQDVKGAKAALRSDYVAIVINARERVAEDACLRRRLEQVAALLDSAGGRIPAMGDLGSPPSRSWYPVSWTSTAGSPVAAALSRDELVMFGEIARTAALTDTVLEKELDDWALIYRVVGPARTISQPEIADLRAAIARAAFGLNQMRLLAPQIEQLVAERRLLTAADLAIADRAMHRVRQGPNYRAVCGPIGAVPSRRVTAPYDPSVQGDPLTGAQILGAENDAVPAKLPPPPSQPR